MAWGFGRPLPSLPIYDHPSSGLPGTEDGAIRSTRELLDSLGVRGGPGLNTQEAEYSEEGTENLDEVSVSTEADPFSAYTFVETLPPDPREIVLRHRTEPPVVRRPLMGLIGYEERFSTLEVIVRTGESSSGSPVELFNSSHPNGKGTVNTNFLIQEINEQVAESVQIVETFGDYYLSDTGEKPRYLSVTGALFEAKNFPWRTEWRANYDRYLRARQCILRRAQAYLTVGDTMYVGYIISTTMAQSISSSWVLVPFQFTMVLRNVIDIKPINAFPQTADAASGVRELVDEVTGQLERYVDGIRIPTTVLAGETASTVPSLISSLRREFGDASTGIEKGGAEEQDVVDPSTALAVEIVQGNLPNQAQLTEPTLVFKGQTSSASTEMNLDRLIAIASAINQSFGTEMFNLQRVRTGYMARRQAELEGMGLYDPYGPASYGLPTAFQSDVDARRRRQQEEAFDAMEDRFNDAFNGIDWL